MTETHDLILLGIAALYVVIGLARAVIRTPYPGAVGWYTVPFLIAFACWIAAVIW